MDQRSAPQISIVVPTFRRPERVSGLLAALAAQEGIGAAKVVVVDNDPAASARAAVASHPLARYVHEPATGVANARNAGVTAAQGDYVLFIDDDELPEPGWLAAFAALAGQGVDAAFGPVRPDYEGTPAPEMAGLVARVFSRDLGVADGADVSHLRAYLGSGNSMFHRRRCLSGQPFDPRFNGGGEDVWLLRRLVEDDGRRLHWCAGGAVREIVPADRMTAEFLRRRRFRDGQIRALVDRGAGGLRGAARTGFWMAAGLVQFLGHRTLATLGRDPIAARIKAEGGRGKMFWWRS